MINLELSSVTTAASTFTMSPSRGSSGSNLVAGTEIHGVEFRRLKMNFDARGSFTEVFQDHWQTCIKPVQWSVVHSETNVFRGLHLHRNHDEYISVMVGRASVGLRDVRPRSPTNGAWSLYELDGRELACISFPSGLLHGWYFHEPSIHLQAVSESYLDYGDSDNWGCNWTDPALQIPWPFTDPILARRASEFPNLKGLLQTLGSWDRPKTAR